MASVNVADGGLASPLLMEAVRQGTEQHVELALQRFPTSINKPTQNEVFPLHIAVWRNHLPVLERLLQAGAKLDVQDGESGWTPLHRALYFGNLAAAQKLLAAGASLDLLDHQARSPLDIVSKELVQGGQRHVAPPRSTLSGTCSSGNGATTTCALYSCGSGANYQLGTGSTDFHETPVRVDAFSGLNPVALAAGKFHSAAVDASGRLYTWGWGRGGRLGHPDPHIHSGERALIHPWAVVGLGKRQVVCMAAAKHHMVVCTTSGEVFSWGSNRDGRLGYAGVDTQPTPKRVASLKSRVTAVAAANKHSVAVTAAGEVWTWGANGHGQLGYGTSDSGANSTPRMVEALKGKVVVQVGCAKRHTVVLTSEGEPLTWGHRVVTPRRVQLAGARDISRASPAGAVPGATPSGGASGGGAGAELRFHKGHQEVVRPVAVALAVGYAHTTVITAGGSVLTWASGDPSLRVVEVLGGLAGKRATCLSASKFRTAVATEQGQVFVWEVRREVQAGGPTGAKGTWAVAALSGSLPAGLDSWGATGPSSAAAAPSSLGGPGATWGLGAGGLGNVGVGGSIIPVRVSGLQRVSALSVGEKHTLALSSWAVPPVPDRQGQVALSKGRSGMLAPGAGARGEGVQGQEGAGARRPEVRSGVRPHSLSSSLDGWDLRGHASSDDESHLDTVGEAGGVQLGSLAASAAASLHKPAALRVPGAAGEKGGQPRPCTAALGLVVGSIPRGSSSEVGERGAASGSWLAPELLGSSAGASPTLGHSWPASAYPGVDRDCQSVGGVDDLQTIAQRAVALQLVEPRTVLSILEYADACGTPLLRAYCIAFCLQNLDAVLAESRGAWEQLPGHLVLELEQHYRAWMCPGAAQGREGGPGEGGQPPWGALGSPVHGMAALGRRDSRTLEGAGGGGWSPPPGSSPVPPPTLLGSSPMSQGQLLGSSPRPGSLTAGSWVDRWQGPPPPLGTSPPPPGTAGPGAWRGQARRSLLQPGRRPTAAPQWLGGRGALARAASGSTTQHAILAALGAIGHLPAAAASTTTAATGIPSGVGRAGGDAQFWSLADKEVEAVAEQRARLVRNIHKKLQQTEALEERRASGAALDAQQLAKLGQKDALLEALQVLDSGTSLEVVQHLLAQAQDLTSRLSSTPVQPGAPGSQQPGTPAPAAGGGRRSDPASTPDTAGAGAASGRKPSGQEQGGALMVDSLDAFPLVGDSPSPWGQGPLGRGGAATPIAASVGGAKQLPPQQTPPGAREPGAGQGAPGSKGKDKEKAARKGGLSLFLSGVLDKPVEKPVQPAPQQPKGPAWGGAGSTQQQQQALASAASLRELLSQEQWPGQGQSQGHASGAGVGPATKLAGVGPVAGGAGSRVSTGSGAVASAVGAPVARGPTAATVATPGAAASGTAAALGKGVSLAEFLPAPTPAKGKKKGQGAKAGNGVQEQEEGKPASGPAWGGGSSQVLGSSPPAAFSLRDIQAEQEKRRVQRAITAGAARGRAQGGVGAAGAGRGQLPGGPGVAGSGSKTGTVAPTAGVALGSAAQLVPVGGRGSVAAAGAQLLYGSSPPAGASPAASKWFVPDSELPTKQALPAIQTEEVAIQQLQKLYGHKVTVRRAAL